MSVLRPHIDTSEMDKIDVIGLNPAHHKQLETMNMMARKRNMRFSKVLKFVTRDKNFGINLPKNLFPTKKNKKNVDQLNNNENETEHKKAIKKVRVSPSATTVKTIDEAPPQYAWVE